MAMNLADTDLAADVGVLSAIGLWMLSHAITWLPVVQFLLGVVGIVAGVSAACYHLKKLRE